MTTLLLFQSSRDRSDVFPLLMKPGGSSIGEASASATHRLHEGKAPSGEVRPATTSCRSRPMADALRQPIVFASQSMHAGTFQNGFVQGESICYRWKFIARKNYR